MRKALITGITGFVGSHLAELLLEKGYTVYGFVRYRADMSNIKHLLDKIKIYTGDMTDPSSIRSALIESKPHEIYHLAANSFVPFSWSQPVEVFNTNAIGFIHLLETIRNLKLDTKIMIACSSEEYGQVNEDEVPIKESNTLRPQSPYAVSKITMDYLAQQYVASYGMKIFISRAFNHTGPRRGEQFVCSNFAKQIVEGETVKHGDLSAVRDFTDVRDIVRAYVLGLNCPEIEWGVPYNIGSGTGHCIEDVLGKLIEFSKKIIVMEEDPERMRPSDVPLLICNNQKFVETTGWEPKISFDKTLKDLLKSWKDINKIEGGIT